MWNPLWWSPFLKVNTTLCLQYRWKQSLVTLLDEPWHGQNMSCESILALFDLLVSFDIINHGIFCISSEIEGGWHSCAGAPTSFRVDSSQWWLGRRGLIFGLYYAGCHRIWCFLLFSLTSAWAHLSPWSEIPSVHWWYPMIYPWQIEQYCECLFHYLEAVRIWMGNYRLQLNPGKTEWLWIWGPTSSKIMPFLVLDGVSLPQRDLVYNLEFLLDSLRLLLNKSNFATIFNNKYLSRFTRKFLNMSVSYVPKHRTWLFLDTLVILSMNDCEHNCFEKFEKYWLNG